MADGVFVHDRGLCESTSVGEGTRVWAFAHVMEGAIIGNSCNIGDHAFIEAGAVLGDRVTVKNAVLVWDKVVIGNDVFLGPNMIFTNDMRPRVKFKKDASQFLPTTVENGVSIGANATIVCGVTLGHDCFIGAGAVVTSDVPAYALMVGNPARQIGWVCECGDRLNDHLRCNCGRTYVLHDSGLNQA